MVNRVRELSSGLRLTYALPAFTLAAAGTQLYVFLPIFYTDVVGVGAATVGAILLGVRVFDAITDPLVGVLSDRTRTRFGRRRPYVALGSLPLAAALYFLFAPPAMTEAGAAWWLGGFLVLLFACWTLVTVPYEALGPELTFRYDERTAVLAWRDGLLLAGTVAAGRTPPLLAAAFGMGVDTDGERRKFAAFAVVYAPLIVASCWVCAWLVRERAPSSTATPSAGYGHVLGNRPFRILLASYTVAAIGGSLPATLLPYYVTYVIGADVEGFLLIYFVVGIACLPGWVWLSRRADKKTVWLAAMAANTGAFIGVYFLGPGDVVAYGTLVSLSGVGFGATIALPSAMQADVIDYGELLTGRRSEGQYLGVWSISRKLAAAAGVGAALPILEWAGYVPGVEQSDAVRHVLSALYALVPCVCNAAGFAIAIAYPITRERHAAIRAAIATRAEGRAVVDPLRKEVTLAPRQQP